MHHRLELGHVSCHFHARKRSNRLVRQIQGVLRRLVKDVRDELVAHEDIGQQVGQDAIALALAVVQLQS